MANYLNISENTTSTTAVLAQAQRFTTPVGPFGDGVVVWHAWGTQKAGQVPVILLHGGSGSWSHWVRNALALAEAGHWVWAVDLPGFGDSDVPLSGGDADALLEPLEVGLATLFGDVQCAMVGFSFGGLTAGLFAKRYAQRVNQLVIVGAPGLGLASRRNQNLKAWRHLPNQAEQRAIHRYNLGVLMLHHAESVDEQAVDIQQSNVPRDRMPGRRLAFQPALAQALVDVHCPVDVIYGFEDALYQGRTELLETTFRSASHSLRSFQFIQNAGHWVQYEAADEFNAVLLDILKNAAPLP